MPGHAPIVPRPAPLALCHSLNPTTMEPVTKIFGSHHCLRQNGMERGMVSMAYLGEGQRGWMTQGPFSSFTWGAFGCSPSPSQFTEAVLAGLHGKQQQAPQAGSAREGLVDQWQQQGTLLFGVAISSPAPARIWK
uniref:Uncharacterized protein n=1 Tax=Sphaerodactylus townsendi TaxID=933632 RepID=A0ACB8EGB1_9SAUR